MHLRTLIAALLFTPAHAQVVTSVIDGNWTDPATWDCLCVPDTEVVLVQHHVAITGDLLFYFDSVHVAPMASLWMPDTNFIIVFGKIQNEGLMDMRGHFDIIGDMAGSGTTVMHGVFHNFGELTMGPGCTVQVEGDLVNEGVITGEGSICITELTYNNGLLSGLIDFCDLSPSTASNPIIDVNSGTVTDDVTYCTNSACWAGMPASLVQRIPVYPLPAGEEVFLSIPGAEQVLLTDAHGRAVPFSWYRQGGQVVIVRGGLSEGMYHVRAIDRNGARAAYARILFCDR